MGHESGMMARGLSPKFGMLFHQGMRLMGAGW